MDDDTRLTEGGNATRLVKLYGVDLRYCHTYKKWLCWNGNYWTVDEAGQPFRYAEQLINYIYRMAAETDDRKKAAEIANFAKTSDGRGHLSNVLKICESRAGVAITAKAMDCDPWLLGTKNVIIDLKTSKTREPRREDLITKAAGTMYDPAATCPKCLAFLDRIFGGDKELIDYIQRAVGYTLTGSMAEQVFFFCHGQGQNGKSKFFTVLMALMGDYAKQANMQTFLVQRGDKVRNDLAALVGARMVSASEAGEGSRFSMDVIKPWTRQEPLTVRFLFGEDFTYLPEGKIWIAANNKPGISARNLAAWRRVNLIPFLVTIPEAE